METERVSISPEIIFSKQRNEILKLMAFSSCMGFFSYICYFAVLSNYHNFILNITFTSIFFLVVYLADILCFKIKQFQFKKPYWSYYLTFYVFFYMIGFIVCEIFVSENQQYLTFYVWILTQILYHIGEFLFVCFCHFKEIGWKSFLINHSRYYTIAFLICLLEVFIESTIFDFQFKYCRLFSLFGFVVSMIGQGFRLGAFISARSNFHHLIQRQKSESHQLVTTGVYSISRHPSYLGFFLQSVGGQILLINPFCIVAYIVILNYFFSNRIYFEELFLVRFFGDEYIEYRNRIGTGIPFLDKRLSDRRTEDFKRYSQ